MIQPMLIEPGSRFLIEQIASRTSKNIPVVLEMTASRRSVSPRPHHIDAINYFEGVIERLDRMVPGGWPRSRTWSELDHRAPPGRAPCRLYLYLQTRIGLDELRRIDAAGAEVAEAMNVHHGLAMAPGIAMTASQVAARGIDAARRELADLIADDSDAPTTPGLYSIRARWTAVRPVATSPDRAPPPFTCPPLSHAVAPPFGIAKTSAPNAARSETPGPPLLAWRGDVAGRARRGNRRRIKTPNWPQPGGWVGD